MKDSKIFVPPVPSLLHLSVVQEAIKLYNGFHIKTLDEVNRRIQLRISMTSEESRNYPGCNIAEKKLLLIIPHLREKVIEAIHGLKFGVLLWKADHKFILELDDGECIFYWRCDGTIDTVKTAQQLVLNSNIDIKKRFSLACMYCLAESIKKLWAEMEATDKTENLETAKYYVVNFWVRWLLDGSRDSRKQAFYERFKISYPGTRFNSIIPLLRPEERRIFLNFIVTFDDLRHCLYSMNEEEEVLVLKNSPNRILYSYLQWPLRSLFFETAEKMWKYFDMYSYNYILHRLLSSEINREVFDFYDFFQCFWNSSPNHLRERARESTHFREKIESCFNEMKRKRKAYFAELINSKDKKLVES